VSELTHAYLLAGISTLCWGVIVVPVKLAKTSGRLGIGISMLTGSVVMLALAGRQMWGALGMSAQDAALFLVTGGLQFALGCMFYYESIRRGSLSVAVPVTRVKVIIILLFAIALGLEVFSWPLLAACLLVVAGGVLVSLRPVNARVDRAGESHGLSLLFAALACLCWAAGETLIAKLPKSISPMAANGLLLWSGLALYGVYALVSGAWREFRRVPKRDVLCYVAHGLISFSIAYVLFVQAIRIAGPARISCVTSTYPLISAVIGWVALGERFFWGVAAGAVLLVGGVVLLQVA